MPYILFALKRGGIAPRTIDTIAAEWNALSEAEKEVSPHLSYSFYTTPFLSHSTSLPTLRSTSSNLRPVNNNIFLTVPNGRGLHPLKDWPNIGEINC